MRATTAIAAILMVLATAAGALALENWETWVTVRSGSAENRLAFGQHEHATAGEDGRFDVPALLAGELQAYFDGQERALWRDVRGTGPSAWMLHISLEDQAPGDVLIIWDPEAFPAGLEPELVDSGTGSPVRMSEVDHCQVRVAGHGQLLIRTGGKEK